MIKKSETMETVAVEPKKMTLAETIWNNIKNKNLEMFALPKQMVNMYCEPIAIEPTKLYLTFTVSAVLPALETALKDLYSVERVDRYIVVSNIVNK